MLKIKITKKHLHVIRRAIFTEWLPNFLKKNGKRIVCIRTVQRDIKMLNEIGLIQTKLRKFGKDNTGHGSVAHYIQNMQLAARHKEIIWEHLVSLLEEKLENKKIVGDFDEDIKNAVFKTKGEVKSVSNVSEIKNVNSRFNANEMSPHRPSVVLNKAYISNINNKNSNNNSKILKNNLNFEKKDVETRLTNRNIPKDFLYRIKDLSNNHSTYINALYNLEMALNDHKESNLKYLLEHFF